MLLLDEVKLLLPDPEQKICNVAPHTVKHDFMFSQCSKLQSALNVVN